MKKPDIVLMTDFGLNWGTVASMHGVCKTVDRDLEIHDLSHTIAPFHVLAASNCLQYTMPYWPKGTVFVSVVDPGVGTARKACVAKTANGYYVVTPDNGTLTHLVKMVGIEEIREIDERVNRYPGSEKVAVFHGRDIFAYCAARLAAGIIAFEGVGPSYPTDEIILAPFAFGTVGNGWAEGLVEEANEHFGNLSSNILIKDFEKMGIRIGDMVHVVIEENNTVKMDLEMPYQKSFGHVKLYEPILYNGLAHFMGLGLNQSSMAGQYGILGGADTCIKIKKI